MDAANRQLWSEMREEIKEQRKLIKVTAQAAGMEQPVLDSMALVLESEGLNIKAIQGGTPAAADGALPVSHNSDDVKADATPVNDGLPLAGGSIKTREQLYKVYYAAMMAYIEKNKVNPPALIDLLKGNYIAREDAHLDANGKLIDPETHEKIAYIRKWDKGDATATILISTVNVRSKRLFADGSIRDGDK